MSIDYAQQAHMAQQIQGQTHQRGMAADVTPPPRAEVLVQCAKTITVTARGPLSARTAREFREELAAKAEQGYRVTSLLDRHGLVEITLERFEPWTLDELIADINSKLGA